MVICQCDPTLEGMCQDIWTSTKEIGITFVRVAGPHPHHASLLKLVCENNPLAKGMNLSSLASSCGLMELRMIRNATQARQLSAPASTLFAADSVTPRKKKDDQRGIELTENDQFFY